jgi:SAM-dependent methyltransferase
MAKPVSAGDWDRRYATKDFIWTVEPNRFLVAEAGGLPPGRGLDLAAGEGRNSIWLAERGWTMRAVDFSSVAAEKGRRLAMARNVADRVAFEVADLADYVPEVHGFDLVALFYLQVPQAALAPILARAARAVAPGGVFLLVAHDSANLANGHGGPQDAAVLYTAEQVVAALDGELEIEKASLVERTVNTDEGPRIALDCLVRARRR